MSDRLIPIEGSVPVNTHEKIGPADPQERIEVTIKLRRKTEEGLPTLEEFVAGKRAKGVTRRIIAERYGSSQDDADAVQRWAVAQGLSVSRVELGSRRMRLVGSAASMSKAFGVQLSMYKHSRTGTHFRCPENNVQKPESLAAIITGVFGLNDMPVVVRHSVRVARKAAASTDPKQLWPGTFYPNEVAKLYNFPATQGQGQRVAVLEFGGGFDPSVLSSYFTTNIGLATPPTVNPILLLNTQMNLQDADTTGEVYLDIEVIGAMAPQATMDVYFAPWTGEGYLTAIEQAIHNDDYAAVSISYGLDEDLKGTAANPGWPMLNQNVDEGFRDAAAVGIPVFVSAGDQGSGGVSSVLSSQEEVTAYEKAAHAAYPATSPYATAVGGTMLYAQNGAITQEIVWNELGPLQQNKYYIGGATGGGVSDHYSTPPSYQTSAGIALQSANTPPVKGRAIPDVAGNAGTTTGYLVSQPPGSQYAIAPVGGTSAAAPMWAALMACIRASLTTTLGGTIPVFFMNDFVYAVGKTTAFRDIVGGRAFSYNNQGGVPGAFTATGNNRSTQANGYFAQAGYDLCTGWGSPNGVELLNQLQTWLAAQKP